MAETPPQPLISPASEPEMEPEPSEYWCYHCDKRVSIETVSEDLSDIICYECKNGFVVSIAAAVVPANPPSPPRSLNRSGESSFSDQFLQVLRLMAEAAREDDSPPPPPPPPPPPLPSSDPVTDPFDPNDYLRIELDGWNNYDDENFNRSDYEIGEEEEEEEGGDEHEHEHQHEDDDEDEDEDDEEGDRRRRREILRLRIRDIASRAGGSRNRILDWSEIMIGSEESAIQFRVQMMESNGYIGNPEDYVDAAGYEALLQNLAESEGSSIRGAPPASKSAVNELPTVTISPEEVDLVCAICKESLIVGEKAKKLPCGHDYHGDCIIPWLDSRNSCPICRFELPTDDPDYEEEKKKKQNKRSILNSNSSSSSSGGNTTTTTTTSRTD